MLGKLSDGSTEVIGHAYTAPEYASLEDGALKYYQSAAKGGRSMYISDGIANVPETGSYTIEFDFMLTAYPNTANKSAYFSLLTVVPTGYNTASASSDAVIQTSWANSNNNAYTQDYLLTFGCKNGDTSTLNGSDMTSALTANTWYHAIVKVTSAATSATVTAKIATRDAETVSYLLGSATEFGSLSLPETMTSYVFRAIHIHTEKNYDGWKIDNIAVYSN